MNRLLFLSILLVFFSCKKHDEPVSIEYPDSSSYGTNILSSGVVNLSSGVEYGMKAILQDGQSINVHLYKNGTGDGIWGLSSSSNVGWDHGTYTGGQWFNNVVTGRIDRNITFEGTFEVVCDVFENGASTSATPTSTKTLIITE